MMSSRNRNNGKNVEPMEEGSDDATEESASLGSASTITAYGTENTSRSNTPTISNGTTKNKTNSTKSSKGRLGKSKQRRSSCAKNQKFVSTNSKYKYSCMVTEDHGEPIFGCQFHEKLKPGEPLILATVGSNRVSIYECTPDGKLKILQVYADPEIKENFYTCVWTHDDTGKPLLAAAGHRGIIRIFAPTQATCVKHFLGHGHDINYLMFHPKNHHLLLSASKDHSLRLTNIKTEFCVAIFGGDEGHRDQVLFADINKAGTRIVSCGMDHSLKVWKLDRTDIQDVIKLSYTYNPKASRPFPTLNQNFPDYSTRDIHGNYVDCAKWFGDFILSKASKENSIVCWKGGKAFQTWEDITTNTTEITIVGQLEVKDCKLWFMRFGLDFDQKTLALGNDLGETYVYDLSVQHPSQIKSTVLIHPKCTKAIRQTAMSRDGSVLICVCDDGTIWRWDLKKEDKADNSEN